jgi:hypothetical protein
MGYTWKGAPIEGARLLMGATAAGAVEEKEGRMATSFLRVSHLRQKTRGKVSMMLALELASAPGSFIARSKSCGSSCAAQDP